MSFDSVNKPVLPNTAKPLLSPPGVILFLTLQRGLNREGGLLKREAYSHNQVKRMAAFQFFYPISAKSKYILRSQIINNRTVLLFMLKYINSTKSLSQTILK